MIAVSTLTICFHSMGSLSTTLSVLRSQNKTHNSKLTLRLGGLRIFCGVQPNSETFQTLVHQVVPKRGMAFSRTCSCDNNIVPQGSDIAWGTFLHPFLSESWLVVMVVLLLTAATLALVVMAGRYLPCFCSIKYLQISSSTLKQL